jgi:hypothetical protein
MQATVGGMERADSATRSPREIGLNDMAFERGARGAADSTLRCRVTFATKCLASSG